ncbi:hypothetical protein O9G_000845 [Rozella allomycis CSF55]|uniref:Uncharacterized protein n=1 Tax=Rozella allomycis (strain CSF55) TaxID=988480 RepID=A0A075ARG4_ROZAC|nr:hypothetical protein O9G_000845 [Rozella allomycis CSF55]|eukprot:EPZ32770.1 hypothetical protein O9G_000845 [Rozella allomycis CSF55]
MATLKVYYPEPLRTTKSDLSIDSRRSSATGTSKLSKAPTILSKTNIFEQMEYVNNVLENFNSKKATINQSISDLHLETMTQSTMVQNKRLEEILSLENLETNESGKVTFYQIAGGSNNLTKDSSLIEGILNEIDNLVESAKDFEHAKEKKPLQQDEMQALLDSTMKQKEKPKAKSKIEKVKSEIDIDTPNSVQPTNTLEQSVADDFFAPYFTNTSALEPEVKKVTRRSIRAISNDLDRKIHLLKTNPVALDAFSDRIGNGQIPMSKDNLKRIIKEDHASKNLSKVAKNKKILKEYSPEKQQKTLEQRRIRNDERIALVLERRDKIERERIENVVKQREQRELYRMSVKTKLEIEYENRMRQQVQKWSTLIILFSKLEIMRQTLTVKIFEPAFIRQVMKNRRRYHRKDLLLLKYRDSGGK